uniref:Ig-like domain-containing protein n=1 Tax=Maylandia zebra TaxID=106582 RepID=A0A3P9DMQ5_9CICH
IKRSGRNATLFSQHALAVVVEVNEGEMSVLLPCQYSGFIPEDSKVLWTRNDLYPKSVHARGEGGDDLSEQNQRYSGRTSMRPDALDTGDFSLTLRKPTKTDAGKYTCSISDGGEELRLRDIQLQVKGQLQTPCVRVKAPSQILSFNPRNCSRNRSLRTFMQLVLM